MFEQSQIDAIDDHKTAPTPNVYTHTMIRIKDAVKSLEFYVNQLGFSLVQQRDFPEMKFSLFFLTTLADGEEVPTDEQELKKWMFHRRGFLELTYNYDTELDDDFSYHNGNDEPRGFGHMAVSVPNIEKACADFAAAGVEFTKTLDSGKMKTIAFIKDPDGYWIEIVRQG